MAGATRAHLANMVQGVTKGYEKKLELVGVGFRASVQGKSLNLTLGFSHPVNVPIPEGISIETPTQTEILIKGIETARRWARSPPRFATSARRNPIRARACATRTRRSPSKKGRRSDYHEEAAALAPCREEPRAHQAGSALWRGCPFTARPITSYAQVTDAEGAKVIAAASTLQEKVRERPQGHRQRGGGQGRRARHCRAQQGRRSEQGRLRPLRIPVPRARQGARGGSPRSGS